MPLPRACAVSPGSRSTHPRGAWGPASGRLQGRGQRATSPVGVDRPGKDREGSAAGNLQWRAAEVRSSAGSLVWAGPSKRRLAFHVKHIRGEYRPRHLSPSRVVGLSIADSLADGPVHRVVGSPRTVPAATTFVSAQSLPARTADCELPSRSPTVVCPPAHRNRWLSRHRSDRLASGWPRRRRLRPLSCPPPDSGARQDGGAVFAGPLADSRFSHQRT